MSKAKNTSSIDDIVKKFGQVFQNAEVLKNEDRKIISASPMIDTIIGGGIPEGSFVVLSGKPALGKTSLALQIAANAQNTPSPFGDRKVFYLDIEGRIKTRDIYDNKRLNLDPERFQLVRSSSENIIYGEQFLTVAEQLIETYPGCVIIMDSISAICSSKRKATNLEEKVRDDGPVLMAAFCKRNSQIIGVNRSIVIGISHMIANQGMSKALWVETGGQKAQYQADVKLSGLYFKEWIEKEDRVGQQVFWSCGKAAIGPPGGEVGAWLRYGVGYDEVTEYIELACDVNIIEKKGSWFSYKDIKVQGLPKLIQAVRDDEKLYDELVKEVRAAYFDSEKP